MSEKVLIPEDVIDEVAKALSMAIGLAMHKAPECVDQLSKAAVRLDDAYNDAMA